MDMVRIILAKYRDETNAGERYASSASTPRRCNCRNSGDRLLRVSKSYSGKCEDNKDAFDEHERITAGDRESTARF